MATTRLASVFQDGTSNVRPINFYLCTLTTDIAAIVSQAKGDFAYDGQALILYVYNGASWVQVTTGTPTLYELLAHKDTASGYAGLDSSALLKVAELPSLVKVYAYSSVSLTINNSVETALTFDSEDYNVGSMHSTSVNPTRFTVPTGQDGYYCFNCSILWDINAAGQRILRAAKNGTLIKSGMDLIIGNGTYDIAQHCSFDIQLVAGDYIEFKAFQDSGNNLNILNGGASKPSVSGRRVM